MPEVGEQKYNRLRTLSTSRGLNGQDLEALAGVCNVLTANDDLGTRSRSKLDGWVAQVRGMIDTMWDGEGYRPSILRPEHLFYMVMVADAGLEMVNDPEAERFHVLYLALGMVPEHVRELHRKLMEMVDQVAAENRKLPRRLRRKQAKVFA